MRILSLALVFTLSLLLSSCLTFIEQYRFNADGSGQFSTLVDMGEMLKNPLFGVAAAEQLGQSPDELENIDTSFNMYEQLIASNPQWTVEEQEYVKRINARMELDFKEQVGGIYVDYDFASVEELAKMQAVLQAANAPEDEDGLGGAFGSDFGTSKSTFEWGRRTLNRSTSISTDLVDGLGLDPSSLQLMADMFADAKLIYIMEFPGRIKKVTGFSGAQNTGNTLTLEFPFLEMLNNPETLDEALDGTVKFKRR